MLQPLLLFSVRLWTYGRHLMIVLHKRQAFTTVPCALLMCNVCLRSNYFVLGLYLMSIPGASWKCWCVLIITHYYSVALLNLLGSHWMCSYPFRKIRHYYCTLEVKDNMSIYLTTVGRSFFRLNRRHIILTPCVQLYWVCVQCILIFKLFFNKCNFDFILLQTFDSI